MIATICKLCEQMWLEARNDINDVRSEPRQSLVTDAIVAVYSEYMYVMSRYASQVLFPLSLTIH